MNRLLTVACLTILISTGCDSPSTSVSNSSNGVTQQPTSRLKQTTVDNVALKPSQPTPGLELLIPDGFSLMDESVIATKYPAGNRPTLVYTNATGAINIAINHTQNRILPNQLKQLHQQLDTSIRQSQPTAKWMFSGFQHYHGREWTQLEFQSEAVDTKIHNMMTATSAQGRMLAISFNCTDEYAGEWLNVGREIIKSAIFTE
ncbi:MAG: hypothetical protein ACK49R_17905 [Planctomycetota bacterium]|jgi:hypothetical protein